MAAAESGAVASGSAASAGQRGVSRVLAKLSQSLAGGEFYEAHMMYRTLYFRYTAQKRYQDCLDLLFDGAQQLIDKEQESSAADLCLLLVDTLEKRGPLDEGTDNFVWVARLGALIRSLSASTVERETLIVSSRTFQLPLVTSWLYESFLVAATNHQVEHGSAWTVWTSGATQADCTRVLD